VVAFGLQEHLCFVLQTAEGLGMNDTVNVSLEAGAQIALGFGAQSAAAVCALDPIGADEILLQQLSFFSWQHNIPPIEKTIQLLYTEFNEKTLFSSKNIL
jgi:hypothetical protein